MTDSKKEAIRSAVENGLAAQFSMYGWDQMIEDCMIDYTPAERKWAKKHLIWAVKEVEA